MINIDQIADDQCQNDAAPSSSAASPVPRPLPIDNLGEEKELQWTQRISAVNKRRRGQHLHRLVHGDGPGACEPNVQRLHLFCSVAITIRPPARARVSFEGGRVEQPDLREGQALLLVLHWSNLVLGGEAESGKVVVGAFLQVGQEPLVPLLWEENPWVSIHSSGLDGKLDASLDDVHLALLQLFPGAFTARLWEHCQPHRWLDQVSQQIPNKPNRNPRRRKGDAWTGVGQVCNSFKRSRPRSTPVPCPSSDRLGRPDFRSFSHGRALSFA